MSTPIDHVISRLREGALSPQPFVGVSRDDLVRALAEINRLKAIVNSVMTTYLNARAIEWLGEVAKDGAKAGADTFGIDVARDGSISVRYRTGMRFDQGGNEEVYCTLSPPR